MYILFLVVCLGVCLHVPLPAASLEFELCSSQGLTCLSFLLNTNGLDVAGCSHESYQQDKTHRLLFLGTLRLVHSFYF